jgi:preprotein translocase subunit SecA
MDDLKQSVQNASYEQKDPLLIYKFEAFNLFKIMIEKINRSIVSTLLKGHIPVNDPEDLHEANNQHTDMSRMQMSRNEGSDEQLQTNREQPKTQPVRVEKKVGRNDPCPCGSGKKYKNCHGKDVA